jgi:hypothetical protein
LAVKTQGPKGLTYRIELTRNWHKTAPEYRCSCDGGENGFSGQAQRAKATRLQSDGFARETFRLPRDAARQKARQMLDQYPKAAYWTEIESWSEYPGDEIEFTMRWLESAD